MSNSLGNENPKRSLGVVWFFLKQYKKLYFFVFLSGAVVSIIESASLGLIWPVLTLLIGGAESPLPSGKITSFLMQLSQWLTYSDPLVRSCVLLLILVVLKFMVTAVSGFFAAYVSGVVLFDTRNALLKKYQQLPYSFFTDQRQGDLKHIVLNSTQRLSYCLWVVTLVFVEWIKFLSILAVLFILSPKATAVVIFSGAVFYVLVTSIFQKFSYKFGSLYMNRQMEMTNILDELITGIKSIFIYRVFGIWFQRFNESYMSQTRYVTKQRVVMDLPKSIIESGTFIIFFSAIIYFRSKGSTTSAADLALMGVMGIAIVKLWPSLYIINRSRLDIFNQLPEVQAIHRILNLTGSPFVSEKSKDLSFQNSIRFQDVGFSYPERSAALSAVNLVIPRGKITALVGGSGGGKTTVINLLLGLYRPDQGKILIDGTDLTALDLDFWRSKVGFVPQDSFMFHGTIAENISFGASYSRNEIVEAAHGALVDRFVKDFPEGYETIVGDRGARLSGGQIQRIAIARAILRKPELLIFDEATSALDNISEKEVQEAIFRSSTNRTVIIIAHRLSTVQKADKIIVLEKGHCVEEGTHAELMIKKASYFSLVNAGANGDKF